MTPAIRLQEVKGLHKDQPMITDALGRTFVLQVWSVVEYRVDGTSVSIGEWRNVEVECLPKSS
jgi:hypothetical protein